MKLNRIYLWIILVCMFNQVNADLPTINEEIKLIQQDVEGFKKDWQKLYDQKKEKFRWPAVFFACMGAAALFGVVTGVLYGEVEGTPALLGKVYGAVGAAMFGGISYGGYHYFTRPRTVQRCICKYYDEFAHCFEKIDQTKKQLEDLLKNGEIKDAQNFKFYCDVESVWKKHFDLLNQCPKKS